MAWFGFVSLLTGLGLDGGLESEVDICKSMLAADLPPSNESQSLPQKEYKSFIVNRILFYPIC